MQLFSIFSYLLLLALCTTTDAQWEVEEIDNTAVRPTTFLQALLSSDFIRNKIDNFIDFVDLKFHQFGILKQLFTVENLITLRRTLEWMVSATNLVVRILPSNPEKPTLITLIRDVLGGPAEDEEDESEEEILALEQDPLDIASTDIYSMFSRGTKTPSYLLPNAIVQRQPSRDHVVHVFTEKPHQVTTASPAPVFENQLRFGGDKPSKPAKDEEEEHPFTSKPIGEDIKTAVKLSLSPEDLEVLKTYNMTPEDAIRLATLLYNARGDKQVKASFEGEVDRVAAMYGEKSPQAMTLSKLVKGPYN